MIMLRDGLIPTRNVRDGLIPTRNVGKKHFESRPTPKKFKVIIPSAGKVMATVFWDSQGVIMTNYLPRGSTVTGAYYANELRELRVKR